MQKVYNEFIIENIKQEKKCNKTHYKKNNCLLIKKSQKLISEISSFLEVLLYYCEQNIDTIETININYIVKYLTKLSSKLYCELYELN